MIFKHSVNSIIRSPGKTFLFLILLTASIVFVNLGSSMNYSANRMLDQADEHFDTVVAFKYGDLHNPDGAWADENFQKNLAAIDFSALSDHPAVIAVDRERTLSAYAGDDTKVWQSNSPVKDYVIVTLRLLAPQDDGSWTALTYDTYFGRRVSGTVYLRVNPYSTSGSDISAYLQPGRTFLLAALAQTAPSSGLTLTPIKPAQMVQDPDEILSSIEEVTDITDQPDYFESAEGQAWLELADTLAVIDKSFQVVATSDLESMVPFHMKQTWLTSGSFQPQEGTCYISERLAGVLGLEVGDDWHLAYHYDPAGNPPFTYSHGNGFAHEEDCQIAGIFHITTDLSYTVLIPYPQWLQKAPDNYDFLRVRVQNSQAEEYLAYVKDHLPQMVELQVEDQGYSNAVVPILKLRERSLYMTIASAAAGVAVICLYAYLFIVRQRETADVMMKLGTGRVKTIAYLVIGIMIIAILSGLAGIYIAGQVDSRLTGAVWQSLQGGIMQDLRYSERALGMQLEFAPELVTASWLRYATTGAVVGLVFVITLIASLITLKKPKRQKAKTVITPKTEKGSGLSFAWLPGLSLRFACRSIKRNFFRSLIVPVAVALLAAFILVIGISVAEQEQAALTIYDEVPTTAYLTTALGRHRQFPIQLQSDVFHMLNNEVQGRQTWWMFQYPATGDMVRLARERLEADNPVIDEFLLTRYMHYAYMGLVEGADGRPGTPNLLEKPKIERQGTSIAEQVGFNWLAQQVKKMPVLALTDSVVRTSEAVKFRESQVQWLQGYSDEDFLKPEYIVVLPDRFMSEQGLMLGDIIRLGVYEPDDNFGVLVEAFDFKVVGSYFQGSRSPVFYVPWNLLTEIKMGTDLGIMLPENPEDPESPKVAGLPNEYLAESVDSATIIPEDPRNLDALRDYLEENGYSQVGIIRSNRLAVVIEDKALADGLLSIQQHLSFLNFIIPIMLLLSGVIAFILSYLLTRNRLPEFAVMRSLGSKKIQVYMAFFLEQFFLLLIGFLPVAVVLLMRPEWLPAVERNLVLFLTVYTLGIIIAIGLMGRSKVLDILFTKE
jgi:ABC-type antimicrobial peptide transport system permease subunit